jgi:hypothetical protein
MNKLLHTFHIRGCFKKSISFFHYTILMVLVQSIPFFNFFEKKKWFGFDVDSELGADGIAASALLATNTAAGFV